MLRHQHRLTGSGQVVFGSAMQVPVGGNLLLEGFQCVVVRVLPRADRPPVTTIAFRTGLGGASRDRSPYHLLTSPWKSITVKRFSERLTANRAVKLTCVDQRLKQSGNSLAKPVSPHAERAGGEVHQNDGARPAVSWVG